MRAQHRQNESQSFTIHPTTINFTRVLFTFLLNSEELACYKRSPTKFCAHFTFRHSLLHLQAIVAYFICLY